MKLPRFLNRQNTSLLVSASFLLAMVVPMLTPAFASAAEVTGRSLDMTSSTVNATGVDYTLTFTPANNADGFVLDFCDNTSVPDTACTAPAGFSLSGVTTAAGGSSPTATGTVLTGNDGVIVDQSLTGGSQDTVVFSGVTNPSYLTSDSTGFYARIVTYGTAPSSITPAITDNDTLSTGSVDTGGIPLATTSNISVTASVAETMTFCVTGGDPGVDCANADSSAPNVTLGTLEGDQYVLNSSTLSTGTVTTQMTTNAASGASVNMVSDATGCGGLLLVGDTSQCNIGPASSTDGVTGGAAAGSAYFGVETAGASTHESGAANALGSLIPVTPYSASDYAMAFTAGGSPTTGVTSPYGSTILDTNSLPANNADMVLTFGASVNDNTAAGSYYADLGLIASGDY